jgi:microcystin-dependent protein
MKKVYSTLLFLFLTSISFAQGISVQGIARDNGNSAIKDTNLTFTFSITKKDNTVLFQEAQAIKTDNFGVFSHIVSTGVPKVATFNSVDFALTELKLKVSISLNGDSIEVYNQPFQYTPYAHYAKRAATADNGSPTGSIMPYVGDKAPEGWVLCDGGSIASINNGAALRALIGDFTPDLRGMFLRGTGTNKKTGYTTYEGPVLQEFQKDENKKHNHKVDIDTENAGEHSHEDRTSVGGTSPISYIQGLTVKSFITAVTPSLPQTDVKGKHNHKVNGNTVDSGTESRPVNFGVNYIIKL